MSGIVLVVDDNPSLGRALALGLKRAGYGVVTCLTGSSAPSRSASAWMKTFQLCSAPFSSALWGGM